MHLVHLLVGKYAPRQAGIVQHFGSAPRPYPMLGSFYCHDFYDSGGPAPYSILVGSRLPRGPSAIAGMISGTPSEVGSFPIRVHETSMASKHRPITPW